MVAKVKWFNNEKGYGFIQYKDNEDVFVHYSSILQEGYKTLNTGDVVEFYLIKTKDGYFNNGTYGDLSDEQANRNFDKALSWLEKGIIPSFLKEDMEAYILTNNDKQMASNERLQIKC